MGLIKRLGLACLSIVAALSAVLLLRTFTLQSHQIEADPPAPLDLEGEATLDRLAQAVRHRTITTYEGFDASAFAGSTGPSRGAARGASSGGVARWTTRVR